MAELGLAVFTAVKEVYLLSRFIARTARSAANHRKERDELDAEFEFEQLYIRSFGQLYVYNEGMLTPQEGLNRAWMKKIGDILESLRLTCGDYAKLASEHDKEYRALSPFFNPPDPSAHIVMFDLPFETSNDQVDVGHSQVSQRKLLGVSHDAGRDPNQHSNVVTTATNLFPDLDWRWALSDKRKLKKILGEFQEATRKLKDLLQLAIATNPQYLIGHSRDVQKGSKAHGEDNLQVLGLQPHIKMRLSEKDENVGVGLQIRDGTLLLPPGNHVLAMGRYIDGTEGDNHVTENVIVEFKILDEDATATDQENIFGLARLLLASEHSDLKTLPFRCITRYRSDTCYAFLFRFPPKTSETTPVSLYDLIDPTNARRHNLSLPLRFHIAQNIAKSLAAFHADDWVHKSLRSRSIAFFYAENGSLDFMTPYLTSFEYSRSTTTNTSWSYDDDTEKNLYRHPDRQRPPSISFNKLHDLWSLGVVLLEIGLWDTAESVQRDGVLKRALSIPVDPHALKDIYLDRVRQDLEHNMGPAYAQAVKTCLLGDFGCGASDVGLSLAVHSRIIESLDMGNLSTSLPG